MGIPAWVWFLVAVLAIAAGVALLIADRTRRAPNNRERRRWAALRGWQFAEVDQVLPTRWERGALAQHGTGTATDVVAGSTFTADGRRQVYVLDLTVNNKVATVLAGVRCRRSVSTILELWQPDVPVPQDSGLDLLGPVGSRYAFVTEVAAARPLVTPALVEAAEEVGPDVTVVWLEQDWVLAAIEPDGADPARLERLLRALGELADIIDPFETDPNEPEPEQAAETEPTRQLKGATGASSPADTNETVRVERAEHSENQS
ncbi:hypothetical protein [Saccharopolyspora gloriosae]|uniref:hypothetical protein n=1 Tax=Saccharopolyspora gloriosae TaxID=455344 RepID=UPI0028682D29|nr:hypothetical protein [Saccharopolyspora gloriosae]